MTTAKQQVQRILDRLPGDASFDDIQNRILVLQALEHGQRDADAGRVLTHEELGERIRSRWGEGEKADTDVG